LTHTVLKFTSPEIELILRHASDFSVAMHRTGCSGIMPQNIFLKVLVSNLGRPSDVLTVKFHIFPLSICVNGPPLWSSGQSS
jgi:hypothetical protein